MKAPHDFQDDIDAINRSDAIPTLLETVTLATGVGFAAVARVTSERWVTCQAVDKISFGLGPGDELDVESTLCHEVRQFDREIVIDDVHIDPVYVEHHCPARYGFRGYVSVPIRLADGSFFGTLCAIDPAPRKLSDERVLAMFRLFAEMIGKILDSDKALAESRAEVAREHELAQVQERFIAILAHDLRNPVNAFLAGLRQIERREIDDTVRELAGLMRGSADRMAQLIETLLDQARERSGGGMEIKREVTDDLGPALEQIVAETRAIAPEQEIEARIDVPGAVYCDVPRLAQLFSNLLSNAVTHGAPDKPIEVSVGIEGSSLCLSVTNYGETIDDSRIPALFRPFEHGDESPARRGLGLGLFIASEIAKGHGGTLTVSSRNGRTVFVFRMPRGA